MIVKLSRYERAAGLFLLCAILGSIAASIGVAIKKGWFTRKIQYETQLDNAEGIHPGTMVQMSGLRAGEVNEVELLNNEKVMIRFLILEKFSHRIKEDSQIQVIRPFLIGEKVLDLSIGSEHTNVVKEGSEIRSRPSMDLMDLVSGKRMNDFLSNISGLVESFRVLARAFSDSRRTEAFVKTLDRLELFVLNMNKMSVGINKVVDTFNQHDRIGLFVESLADLTQELKKILPELSREAPQLGKNLGQMVQSIAFLAKEFEVIAPAMQEIAPDLPRTSRRVVEALDEAVVLLKAMQKSFFLKSNVKEVKEEEQIRQPAFDRKKINDEEQK